MIKLIDIQSHVIKKLKNNFPDHTIYREENQANPKAPAFYVDVRPLETVGRSRYSNKLVNVSVQYISKDKTKQENLLMADRLEDVFYLILEVHERRLSIESLSISEVAGVLTVSFTLDYNADFRRGSGYPNPNIPDEEDVLPGYREKRQVELGYGEGLTKKMGKLHYNKGDV